MLEIDREEVFLLKVTVAAERCAFSGDCGSDVIILANDYKTIKYKTELMTDRFTNSSMRYAKARVNGVNGVIILPDSWRSIRRFACISSDGRS